MKNLKHKKIYTFALLSFLVVGLASAVWILYYAPDSTGMIITSEGALQFSDDFGLSECSTTSGLCQAIDTITITNLDGERNLNVSFETIITDVEDNCDAVGDHEVTLHYEGYPVYNGEIISITSGEHYLIVNTTSKDLACPGTISTNVILDGKKI